MRASLTSGSTTTDAGARRRSTSADGCPGSMRASSDSIDSVTGVPSASARATGESGGSQSSRMSVYRSSSSRRAGSTCHEPTSLGRPSRSTTVTMQASARVGTTIRASRPSADSPSRAPESSAASRASSAVRADALRAAVSAAPPRAGVDDVDGQRSGDLPGVHLQPGAGPPGQRRLEAHRPVGRGLPERRLEARADQLGDQVPQGPVEQRGPWAVEQPLGLGVGEGDPPVAVEQHHGGRQPVEHVGGRRTRVVVRVGLGSARIRHCRSPTAAPLRRPRRWSRPRSGPHRSAEIVAGRRGAAKTRRRGARRGSQVSRARRPGSASRTAVTPCSAQRIE